jgi:hypothetical protein
MGFPKRKFQAFDPVSKFSIHSDQFLEGAESTKLINNTIAAHRTALKCIHHGLGLTVASGDTWDKVLVVEPGLNASIITIPMNGIVTGASKKVRVWAYVTRDDSASSAFVWVQVGREFTKVHLTETAGNYEWLRIDVPVDQILTPALISDLSIQISCGVDWDYGEGNQETIRIRSVSVGEPAPRNAQTWVDTSGTYNQMFNDDGPLSPAVQRIFNQKLNAAWTARSTRQNIFNLCYRNSRKTLGAAFDGDLGGQGYWMIRKSQDVDTINAIVRGSGKCDLSLSLWSNDSLVYGSQVVNYVVGDVVVGQTSGAFATVLADNDAGATGTLSITKSENGAFQNGEVVKGRIQGEATLTAVPAGPVMIAQNVLTDIFTSATSVQTSTFAAGLITEDVEYELRVDARDPSGGGGGATSDLTFVWLGEDLDSAVDYDLPNPMNTENDDDVIGLTWRRADQTIDHAWNRQRQTLLNDARQGGGNTGQLTGNTLYVGAPVTQVTPSLGSARFMYATLNQTPGAGRRVRFVLTVRRPDQSQVYNVDLNPFAGTISGVGTGATSGVTADVLNQSGTPTKVVTFDNSPSDFILGETINFSGGGSGTVVATRYRPDISINLSVGIAKGSPVAALVLYERELDISKVGTDRSSKLETSIDISNISEGDISIYATGVDAAPIFAFADPYTTNLADYLIFESGRIYEEVIPPGGILMSQQDYDAKT